MLNRMDNAGQISLTVMTFLAAAALPGLGPASHTTVFHALSGEARAQTGQISEREAFAAAKELGTIEAWEAFLNAFPTGYRADIARAYLSRIAAGSRANSSSPPLATQTSPSAAPIPAAPVANTQPSRPQTLPTYPVGLSTSPWRNFRYEMDEGNSSTYAAGVSTNGVEFLLYCNRNRKLAAVLRERGRGIYPQFDQRIEQGLA